jgi:hypothetical protein
MLSTGSNKVVISNPAINAIQSTNAFSSFIIGRLERAAAVAGADYLFPIGKPVLSTVFYAPIRLNKINANATSYTAEYFWGVPFDRTNRLFPPIDHVSFVEYWEITSQAPAGSTNDDAALSLSWRTNSVVSPDPIEREDLMMAHYRNNFGFRWEHECNTATVNIISGNADFGSITSNITVTSFTNADRRFTLSSRSANNVLPVNQMDWFVKTINQQGKIYWTTNNDTQIDSYVIERGSSPFQFSPIGTTVSKKQPGISNYQFIDPHPFSGKNYYRIRLKLPTGEVLASDIKTIQFSLQNKVRISPVPAQDVITVQLAEIPKPGTSLQLISADGKIVYHTNQVQRTMELSLHNLIPGYYILKITTPESKESYPFIKQE